MNLQTHHIVISNSLSKSQNFVDGLCIIPRCLSYYSQTSTSLSRNSRRTASTDVHKPHRRPGHGLDKNSFNEFDIPIFWKAVESNRPQNGNRGNTVCCHRQ